MTRESESSLTYVFGYGSLVTATEPLRTGDRRIEPVPGKLRGFGRGWAVAMDNRAAAPREKHFVDPTTGLPPLVRVAFLDVREMPGRTVNGLAIPVDAERLAALDAREVNYERVDVSPLFAPRLPRVFVYRGTASARRRCQAPAATPVVVVSEGYVREVRCGFESLGSLSISEFERTTDPCPFPLRRLELVRPGACIGGRDR